jgi:hypothetical protein
MAHSRNWLNKIASKSGKKSLYQQNREMDREGYGIMKI